MMLEGTADPHPGALAPEPGLRHLLLASRACGSGAGPELLLAQEGRKQRARFQRRPQLGANEGRRRLLCSSCPPCPWVLPAGGKTQPLLHPSPADRDERGGIMQSSCSPLPGTAHPTTNTAEPLRRCGRGFPALPWGEAAAPAPALSPSPSPSSPPAPLGPPRCCRRMGIPWDLQHPASPAAGGDAGVARGSPALAFAMAEPPQAEARLCVCSGAACALCARWKNNGERHGGDIAPHPRWLQQGKGFQARPHRAGATAGATLPRNGALHSARLLVNKCTAHTCHSGGWGGPAPTRGA